MKNTLIVSCFLSAMVIASVAAESKNNSPTEQAQRILKETGVTGGLVVHLGCGDPSTGSGQAGKLTAALRASDAFLVQGLDADVTKARENIRAARLYGPVSAAPWSGGSALPYVDNLVNLLVITDDCGISRAEMERVLAPGGVLFFDKPNQPDSSWHKPWPTDIDEWTHTMHDPGGNGVAHDRVVGPPRHLQWTAGPLWQRSHGYTPSVSAVVTARGRLFSIVDETLTGADDTLPSRWFLVARDAFNGKLLWKRPVPDWGSKAFEAVSREGRYSLPHNTSKRLVAVGDAVYVTLGAKASVTALDAATGQEQRVFGETAHTDEIVMTDGVLLAAVNPERPTPVTGNVPSPAPGKRLRACDLASGRLLWEQGPFDAIRAHNNVDIYGRFELVAGDGRVFVLADQEVTAFDLKTGKSLWQAARPSASEAAVREAGWAGVFEVQMASLVYANGVLLLAQPEPNKPHTWHLSPGRLHALDGATGRSLWQHDFGFWAMSTPPDVFVVGDLVWTHTYTLAELSKYSTPKKVLGKFAVQALDLRTGAPRQQWSSKEIADAGHHHRCYRNRITEKYMTVSRRGVEFLDLATGENFQNHWIRSGCMLGQFPANGLLYLTPHSCGCYLNAKLKGFNALAAQQSKHEEHAGRLEKGPAYNDQPQSAIGNPSAADWPTYRHDPQRSGATDTPIPLPVQTAWATQAGTALSAPVIAGGRVLVADAAAHAVRAFAADSGKPLWSFTADGPVLSPPVVDGGLAMFGAMDGRVYAVRAADGVLAWRFDAAPDDRRMVAFERVESVWPVPGVLVKNGQCWFAAGRSSYVDGGIRWYVLEATTGKMLQQKTVFNPDPVTGKQPMSRAAYELPGLTNDIPVAAGDQVFIGGSNLAGPEAPAAAQLYFTGGFLDATLFNRTAWVYRDFQTAGPMVLGPDAVYGVELYPSGGRDDRFKPGQNAYRLMRFDQAKSQSPSTQPGIPTQKIETRHKNPTAPQWESKLPVRVTALARAGDVLFLAGPPDVVDPADPHAAWDGRKGTVLLAVATADGRELGRTALPALPVWDGLALADGSVFLTLANGQLLRLSHNSLAK